MKSTATNQPISEVLVPLMLATWREAGATHWIAASGESMHPLIRSNDQLLVRHAIHDMRRGSIVVFFRDHQLVAHRVIARLRGTPDTLLTKGDNVRSCDAPIAEDAVVGEVVALRRGDRQVDLTARRWRLVGHLIAVAALAEIGLQMHVRRLRRPVRPMWLAAARRVRRGLDRAAKFVVVSILHLERARP